MLYLFRPDRENPDSLVEIPFYNNRKLLPEEFLACAEEYSVAKWRKYLAQLDCRPQKQKPIQWPDYFEGLGLSPEEVWKYNQALLQMQFAGTKQQQQQAREWVNMLAEKGANNKVKQAIGQARRSILADHQAKRTLSMRQLFVGRAAIFDYRAKRQFLWRFLGHESDLDKGQRKEGKTFDRRVQELATYYSCLGALPKKTKTSTNEDFHAFKDFKDVTTAKIAEGLRNPKQANEDTAKKIEETFGIKFKASSVGPLLSKLLHR